MRSTSIPNRMSPGKDVPKSYYKSVKMGLKGGGCPIGTVPIRRITKDDLIRAKLHSQMYASKINPLVDGQDGTHVSYIFITIRKRNFKCIFYYNFCYYIVL